MASAAASSSSLPHDRVFRDPSFTLVLAGFRSYLRTLDPYQVGAAETVAVMLTPAIAFACDCDYCLVALTHVDCSVTLQLPYGTGSVDFRKADLEEDTPFRGISQSRLARISPYQAEMESMRSDNLFVTLPCRFGEEDLGHASEICSRFNRWLHHNQASVGFADILRVRNPRAWLKHERPPPVSDARAMEQAFAPAAPSNSPSVRLRLQAQITACEELLHIYQDTTGITWERAIRTSRFRLHPDRHPGEVQLYTMATQYFVELVHSGGDLPMYALE